MQGIRQEQARQDIQKRLDSSKSRKERNRLGQFSTPIGLAREIVGFAASLLDSTESVSFLDPAIGTGAFYSALLQCVPHTRIARADGFEIDSDHAMEATTLWRGDRLRIHQCDFTRTSVPRPENTRSNFLICNPPYVRHHHIPASEKQRLQQVTWDSCGVRIAGLAGLYCYFLGMSHSWMRRGGIAAWLVPSEFMDVGYGKAIKKYLLEKVSLVRIHRFDPQHPQFDEALVSSSVIWFRNNPPKSDHAVEFTYGGAIGAPDITRRIPVSDLRSQRKWSRFPAAPPRCGEPRFKVGNLFAVKRGIATGGNKFFILSAQLIQTLELPIEMFRPVLPSPRYLQSEEIFADQAGVPILDKQLFLLNCRITEREIERSYPTLWRYLEEGKNSVAKRYLCRSRKVWYFQEEREPAPIMSTYIGRRSKNNGRIFRFFLNHSIATAPNVYLLLYPKIKLATEIRQNRSLLRRTWEALNQLSPDQLADEGRVYGGGLYKLEPRELANVDASVLVQLVPQLARCMESEQADLFPE